MPHRLALNTDLSAAIRDALAPEWVELIPAGPAVTGRDGRSWLFDAEAATSVLTIFQARGVDLAIDRNHAIELKAPKGEESPAAGWINRLEMREGALWGHVDWTPRGATEVAGKEYRYLSPVFDYDPATGRIVRLVSVALSNKPNLRLTALNSEETPVPLSAALAVVLGIPADSTDEAAVAAVNLLKATATAANSETRNLDKYVPRADYDQVLTRATNAEQTLATQRQADHGKAVDAEIDAALKAGKITPATVDYHRASCSDQAGLERFKAFVTAAAVVAADPANLDKKPDGQATALNAEELAVCRATGVEPSAFLATKAGK